MTRSQRWLLVVAGIAGVLLFVAAAVYYATAATGQAIVEILASNDNRPA